MMETAITVQTESFLSQLTDTLLSRYENDLGNLCIVFPNRRAGLFFRKYLAERLTQAAWSPEITTIKDFISSQAKLTTADQLSLIIKLYDIFKKLGYKDTFDRFYSWGEMLLKDFDEIDKYLADPAKVFDYIESVKDLEERFGGLEPEQAELLKDFWSSIRLSRPSDAKKEFEGFWKLLYKAYTLFGENLIKEGIAYDGLAAKHLATDLSSLALPEEQSFVFAGFNSLNRCEELLIKYLTETNKAIIVWDADSYYLNDKKNEAGRFIRKYQQHFTNSIVLQTNNFSDPNKKITLTAVSKNIGQVKAAGQILSSIVTPENENRTAVIMPDESLLLPLLHSLPDNIQNLNVTMGFDFRHTLSYRFVKQIIELQKSKNAEGFYHKEVYNVLRHPFVYNSGSENINAFISRNIVENTIRFKAEDLLMEGLPVETAQLFGLPENALQACLYLEKICSGFISFLRSSEVDNSIEFECTWQFSCIIKRLSELLSLQELSISTELLWRILQKIIAGLSIPFTGEPLKGLQVMGTLETRTLDFENLIVLSCNEGFLPPSASTGSFIPFALRKAFGLTTPETDDAIYAYYFYRLLQRAKHVHLLYNTESEGGKSSELSRFVRQLEVESELNIKHQVLKGNVVLSEVKTISIVKSEPVLKTILEKFQYAEGKKTQAFSPSSVQTLIDCSLKFYFRYIAQLKEPEESSETIDAALFGEMLHYILEKLYADLKEKKQSHIVEKADFIELRNELQNETLLLKAFTVYFKYKNFTMTGRNLLIKEVLKEQVLQILKIDEVHAPFDMVALEDEELSIPLTAAVPVLLKGRLDRIDEKDGMTRIIDYKSGLVERSFFSLEGLFAEEPDQHNKTAQQALFYALLYNRLYPGKPFTAGIYSTREIFESPFEPCLEHKPGRGKGEVLHKISEEILQEYEQHLKTKLNALFDPSIPFQATSDESQCPNCPYNLICQR